MLTQDRVDWGARNPQSYVNPKRLMKRRSVQSYIGIGAEVAQCASPQPNKN